MTIVSLRVEGVGGEGGKQQFVIANTPEISGISKYTHPLQQLWRCGGGGVIVEMFRRVNGNNHNLISVNRKGRFES